QDLERHDHIEAVVRLLDVVNAAGREGPARIPELRELHGVVEEVEAGDLEGGHLAEEDLRDKALATTGIEQCLRLEALDDTGDLLVEAVDEGPLDRVLAGVLTVVACIDLRGRFVTECLGDAHSRESPFSIN